MTNRLRLSNQTLMHAAALLAGFAAAACGDETVQKDAVAVEPTPLAELQRDLALGDEGGDVLALYGHLKAVGYFPSAEIAAKYPAWRPAVSDAPADPQVFDARMEKALLTLQRNNGLLETGIVDADTRALLRTPRCGVPDNIAALDPSDKFSPTWGSRWPNLPIRWKVTNAEPARPPGSAAVSLADARREAAAAFATWARATNLTFTEVTAAGAATDINITFQDVAANLIGQQPNPPPAAGVGGDIYLDPDVNWSASGQAGMQDLQTGILHEAGHALGLNHSSIAGATMQSGVPLNDRTLAVDDRVGISVLYDMWDQLSGEAVDLGVNTSGTAWAIGTTVVTGGLSIKKWNGSNWDTVPGGAMRIAVDPNGRPWTVNSSGQIHRRRSSAIATVEWDQMPGCATDIAIGKDGTVWHLGCNAVTGGYGLHKWNGTGWNSANGGAVRITVDENGRPWTVNDQGHIHRRLSNAAGNANWEQLPGCGRDIAIGEGTYAWVIGCNELPNGYGIYVWNEQTQITGTNPTPGEFTWRQVTGAGTTIAVGLRGTPWHLNTFRSIYRFPDTL